ncbi:uncharacterized protein MCYG_05536 [Microsporum canis CBS 113480]|uniref:Uncharacterized protein n=1 Tax=Arthroderma otae (strain ATCC MYA-4605 / CBS 113480) TaxID=554155 RepID=C5FS64_ARTOC|nr:uncharacterized protein MCYG_05536 [Microsporum canis CBS 113480]EEQ32717.1 predicted protein [Microsporum canis CBS 113480]
MAQPGGEKMTVMRERGSPARYNRPSSAAPWMFRCFDSKGPPSLPGNDRISSLKALFSSPVRRMQGIQPRFSEFCTERHPCYAIGGRPKIVLTGAIGAEAGGGSRLLQVGMQPYIPARGQGKASWWPVKCLASVRLLRAFGGQRKAKREKENIHGWDGKSWIDPALFPEPIQGTRMSFYFQPPRRTDNEGNTFVLDTNPLR